MNQDIYLTFFCLSEILQTITLLVGREAGGEWLEGSGEGGLQGCGEGARPRQDYRRGPRPGEKSQLKVTSKNYEIFRKWRQKDPKWSPMKLEKSCSKISKGSWKNRPKIKQ